MYFIFGLGNPGRKYDNSRHNIGFEVIDRLANDLQIKIKEFKFKAFAGEGFFSGEKILLVKPTTYMNQSGQAVRDFMAYYKLSSEEIASKLIVVYDDIDFDCGKIKIKQKGSAGGHNGMKDIIYHLETEDFIRCRVGVGAKPENIELSAHVLGYFSKHEAEDMLFGIISGADAIKDIIEKGAVFAMNKYN